MYKRFFFVLLASIHLFPQNPKADPVLSYDWIIGRWECKGITPAGKVDYTFAQQIERPPGSRWFRFHAVPKSSDVDPALASDTSFETYDSNARPLALLLFLRLWSVLNRHRTGFRQGQTIVDWLHV